eukprot:1190375-Prorocentrum_minimum.AAC.6
MPHRDATMLGLHTILLVLQAVYGPNKTFGCIITHVKCSFNVAPPGRYSGRSKAKASDQTCTTIAIKTPIQGVRWSGNVYRNQRMTTPRPCFQGWGWQIFSRPRTENAHFGKLITLPKTLASSQQLVVPPLRLPRVGSLLVVWRGAPD